MQTNIKKAEQVEGTSLLLFLSVLSGFLLEVKISIASLVGDYTNTGNLPENPDGVIGVVGNVADFLLSLIGILAILAFVVAGLQYMTAYGDDKAITSAKQTMKYAIIGLAVALSGLIAVYTVDALLT